MSLVNPVRIKSVKSSNTIPATVASSIDSTVLLVANSNRIGATIYNNSLSDLYVDLDSSTSTDDFAFKIAAEGGYYQLPYGYVGIVSGIWDTANGSAMIREFLP